MHRRILCCLAVACVAGVLAGCSTLNLFRWGRDDYPTAGPKNPVVQVLALWQPGEGPDSDGNPTRGFVGQVYFFTNESPIPAMVDGEVRVYLFDDQGTQAEQVKPIHQFDFPAETWKVHAGKGKLGPTYALFIPYTRKGAHAAQCSLRVRFQPRVGQKIFSEMSNVMLPGTKSSATAAKSASAAETAKVGQLAAREKIAEKRTPANLNNQTLQDVLASIPRVTENNTRRGASAPLTEAERARILREAREKLGADSPAANLSPRSADGQAKRPTQRPKAMGVSIDRGQNETEPAEGATASEARDSDDQASTGYRFHWKSDSKRAIDNVDS